MFLSANFSSCSACFLSAFSLSRSASDSEEEHCRASSVHGQWSAVSETKMQTVQTFTKIQSTRCSVFNEVMVVLATGHLRGGVCAVCTIACHHEVAAPRVRSSLASDVDRRAHVYGEVRA
jgi:hypothetical protein